MLSFDVLVLRRFFNQGLRFTSAFKFNYAVESHIAALQADPNCSMCEWGLSLAYGQNLNDALVLALEPWFLDNEPLAYDAVRRAKTLISAEEGGGDAGGGNPSHDRDTALVSALARRYVSTVEEYKSHFEDGLPTSLNLAYAEAMADAAELSAEEGWPDHVMVLVLSADAWMNLSPWHCEFARLKCPQEITLLCFAFNSRGATHCTNCTLTVRFVLHSYRLSLYRTPYRCCKHSQQ